MRLKSMLLASCMTAILSAACQAQEKGGKYAGGAGKKVAGKSAPKAAEKVAPEEKAVTEAEAKLKKAPAYYD